MKKQIKKHIALALALCMLLSLVACGDNKPAKVLGAVENDTLLDSVLMPDDVNNENANITTDENGNTFIKLGADDFDDSNIETPLNNKVDSAKPQEDEKPQSPTQNGEEVTPSFNTAPKGEYNEGVVLVKFEDKFSASALGTLEYTSAEVLYEGSKWYSVKLADQDKTEEAVKYLTELGRLQKVDYDYIMGVTADTESVDVSCNPDYDKHKHHHTHKIPDGWKYATDNGKNPGGSSDVVIAVIDTGVDYNHLDLRNNIWKNSAEIADNGKDDDGNGYIDDVYGWDCVGDDNDPMDDNGHGTHVAGIVAAENNKIGGIGVAYNCKVMVLKAGNSSGYFNNSDIAEAIQYAYMNGASVINMSFGGSSISIAVEEALENAYNTCVLVAAAGNDGLCNQPGCGIPMYPASLTYVIGVMSTDENATRISSFSNFDEHPYNKFEYEVFAVGEAVPSTWPDNRYATLNGTSMAAPTVAGVAALLRSYYSDREMYSTKFIQSQIVNTGTVKLDGEHAVVDIYGALTKTPKPAVNLYDYYIDDGTAISSANNGNGVIDAGETVRLYISLHNRGGVASDASASIDTERSEGLTDPYFTFINTNITLSDIGTYSVRESGDKYFEIIVDSDCPNDYLVNFNIRFTYKNGMDENDNTNYSGEGVAQFNVSRGFYLPATITENTVYKADKLYIVGQDVVIPEGVTVTFEEGCEIQFYDDSEYYTSPRILSYGKSIFNGTKDKMISITPNERHMNYVCVVQGDVEMNYCDCINVLVGSIDVNTSAQSTTLKPMFVNNSNMRTSSTPGGYIYHIYGGKTGDGPGGSKLLVNCTYGKTKSVYYQNCYIEIMGLQMTIDALRINNCLLVNSGTNISPNLSVGESFKDNMFISCEPKGYFSTGKNYINGLIANNYFLHSIAGEVDLAHLSGFDFKPQSVPENNAFCEIYQQYASQTINNYIGNDGTPVVDVYGSLSDPSLLWPYVVSVEMFDKDDNVVTTIGKEEIKVRVTFNRPMDTTKDTFVTFGTIEPYADYRIDGEYINDTVWEGTYTLKAQIENGQNFLKVNNACAAEDQTKTVFGEYFLHEFTIDTTAAMSMNLQAVALDEGIKLTFLQDDYDTLLGYNIYRSTEKDGNYVRLNPTILMAEETTFLDDNAEPGKTYWYTYTVVLSDFTESNPAGKVVATAKDTMAPSLYHTPVNQGYENNNLVISCTASDNVAIQNVTLYYRTIGTDDWKTLVMVKQNDKYSATIFGSDVTLEGLEYYIVASDVNNSVQKGSAETPYTILVKSADSLLGLGDVDGNGTVTTKDALMLMQCINGDLILTDDQFKRADLNKDNVLSSAEALRILQYVNGKLTTLEM